MRWPLTRFDGRVLSVGIDVERSGRGNRRPFCADSAIPNEIGACFLPETAAIVSTFVIWRAERTSASIGLATDPPHFGSLEGGLSPGSA